MTAHWTAITYYVSYNSNKPSKASSNPTGIMLNSEHKYLPASALSGNTYSLKGWSFKNGIQRLMVVVLIMLIKHMYQN